MQLSFAIFAFACVIGNTLAADIMDCSKRDSPGKLIKADVKDCKDEDDVCILKRGANASIVIQFETKEVVSKIKQQVHGIIRSVPIPFKLPNENACVDTKLTCPLAVGTHTYEYGLFVKPVYPTVSHLEVKWQLTDVDTGKDVVCIEIPAAVK